MILNDNRIVQGTNGILLDSKQILDPTKYQSKGRSQAKRLKLFIEKSSLKGKNGVKMIGVENVAYVGNMVITEIHVLQKLNSLQLLRVLSIILSHVHIINKAIFLIIYHVIHICIYEFFI